MQQNKRVIAYEPHAWLELFAAVAGAAAALTGLLFVAVSLNIKEILESPGLPPLAARSLQLLLGLLLLSILALVPGQTNFVLGVEITVLGVALVALAVVSVLRSHFPVVRWQWSAVNLALALISTVPMVLAGVTLATGRGGGLDWAILELIAGFVISVYNAWILLVEIKR